MKVGWVDRVSVKGGVMEAIVHDVIMDDQKCCKEAMEVAIAMV